MVSSESKVGFEAIKDLTLSLRSGMNETWAPSALPGVVDIVHNLFKSSRFCLIRYDLARLSQVT